MTSQSTNTALSGRTRSRRVSVSTAVGIAAERAALADRERERRTAHARIAARQLDRRPVAHKH